MTHTYLSDDWHWGPMLVADKLLTKNKINYIILGSAAIQHHWVRKPKKDHTSQSSPPPWNFANTFEIGIASEDISRAVEVLCKDNLFEKQDDEDYDTMYEGTSRLTKLRSTWDRFAAINLILLPTEEYYVIGHPLMPRDKPCSYMCDLPFTHMSELVLSLLHRTLSHKDHTAGHALHRMDPFHLRIHGEGGVKPPADWPDEVRKEAAKWLKECGLLPDQNGNGPVVRRELFGDATLQPWTKVTTATGLGSPILAVKCGQKRKADAEEDGNCGLFGQKRAKDTF